MKKSNMMRLASCLLVLVMLTTCMISGTFAKYVTSDEGTDSARVAKWGVEVTANGETFADAYATDDAVFTEANSVISSDNTDVVAPGTAGNMTGVTLAGTPEVAARVTYDAAVTISDNWVDADGGFYCPIVIQVGTTEFSGLDYATAAAFEAAVESAINDYAADYAAGTNLAAAAVPAVSWEWPFDVNAENDEKDTFLGEEAADDNAATIQVTVKTTVTQIN